MRLVQANLATKVNIADFVKETDFDNKLKNINKKVTPNKTKHVEAEKKLNDLTKKVAHISEKGYDFLLGRIFFTGDNGYQNFLVFAPIHNSLTLDNNKKFTNWILTRTISEKIEPFDIYLELNMSNLANGRVHIEFSNSALRLKNSFLIYT